MVTVALNLGIWTWWDGWVHGMELVDMGVRKDGMYCISGTSEPGMDLTASDGT